MQFNTAVKDIKLKGIKQIGSGINLSLNYVRARAAVDNYSLAGAKAELQLK